MANSNKNALLLGSNPVSESIGKVMDLLGVEVSDNGACDILVMVDGDKYEVNKLPALKNKFNGTEKVIYLESSNKNLDKHNLLFLTEICETYRIPLEHFSIVELGKIIDDIPTSSPSKAEK